MPVYPVPEAMKAASALTHTNALICTSAEISSPLTLGWLAPVVLIPGATLALGEEALCGVICHELVHIARHDWIITIFEELAGHCCGSIRPPGGCWPRRAWRANNWWTPKWCA